GIGTASPISNLHINTTSILGTVKVEGSAGTLWSYAAYASTSGQRNWFMQTLVDNNVGMFKWASMSDDFISAVNDNILVLRTNGKVGIGTKTIPRFGVGGAKLAIDGLNANVNGPHIQTTTSSDSYPLLQLLSHSHDNVHIGFDAYWDGSWRSSDVGSNFAIQKNADKFIIKYDNGIAQGSVITFVDGISLDTAGRVGIGTGSPGLRLTFPRT
ncbi:hypothetical protein LCGC14_3029130, partial [marine sediment metagenome]